MQQLVVGENARARAYIVSSLGRSLHFLHAFQLLEEVENSFGMSHVSAADIRESIRIVLRNADLSALSSKSVRRQLEAKYITDFTFRKQEIDDILMSLIDEIEEGKQKNNGTNCGSDDKKHLDDAPGVSSNGISTTKQKKRARSVERDSSSGTDDSEHETKKPLSSKKTKNSTPDSKSGESSSSSDDDDEDYNDDEAYARKLHEQELRMRPRSSKQKAEKKQRNKNPEKPSRRKGNSLYSQECVLSQELADVMGTDRMARKDVVSRMWKIFKERDLMDPKNKQYVICDEQLEKVFKCKKFKGFVMMKFLKAHIKDAKLVTS